MDDDYDNDTKAAENIQPPRLIARSDHIEEADTQPPQPIGRLQRIVSCLTIIETTTQPGVLLDTLLTTTKSNDEVVATQSSQKLHAGEWEAGRTWRARVVQQRDNVTAMVTGR